MRYGPPTLTLGSVYAPPLRVLARYCVPLGTCTATTVAPLIGVAAVSLTKPVTVAVVTPCAGAPCGAAMIDSTSKTSDGPNVETRGISASRTGAGQVGGSSVASGPRQTLRRRGNTSRPDWISRAARRTSAVVIQRLEGNSLVWFVA